MGQKIDYLRPTYSAGYQIVYIAEPLIPTDNWRYSECRNKSDLISSGQLNFKMSYMDWFWLHLPYGHSIQHLLWRSADAMRHLFSIDEDTNGSTTVLTAILKWSFKFKKISSGHFDSHNELQKIIISESDVTIGMSFFRIDRAAQRERGRATHELTPNSAWLSLEKKTPRSTMKRIYFAGLKNTKSHYTS